MASIHHPNAKVWTEEEDEFLRTNWKTMTHKEMCIALNETYHKTQWRLRQLGLSHFKSKTWTPEDLEFLVANYGTKGGRYCCTILERGLSACQKKAAEFGLSREWTYRYISQDGYVMLCNDRNNAIAEHRKVASETLGRPLLSEEVVHHIDEDKTNNDPGNLQIMTRAEHIELHRAKLYAAQISKVKS